MSTTIVSDKKAIIKWIICLVVALLPALIPETELYTLVIKKFLVITLFVIMIIAFELLDSFIAVIGMLIAWVLAGVCNYTVAFSGWTSSTCMMLVFALLLVNILDRVGLIRRIGYNVIIRTGGTFKKAMWGLFMCSLLITALGFVLSSTLAYAFAYAFYKAMELKPTDKEAAVIVMITMLSAIQSSAFIYCPLAASVMGSAITNIVPEYSLTIPELVLYNWPVILFCILMTWLTLAWYDKTTQKDSASNLAVTQGKIFFQQKLVEMGQMSRDEKIGLGALLFTMIYMLTQVWHGYDAVYAFVLPVIFLYLPKVTVGNSNDMSKIPWTATIGVVMGFLAVGTVGGAIGVNTLLAQLLLPFMAPMGEYWGAFGTFLMGALVNFVLSPFAMMAMLPGIIIDYCQSAGFNFLPHVYAMWLSRDMIFLPYEYPSYLILFGFGMLTMGKYIKLCLIKAAVYVLFFIAIIMPYWHLILGVI